MDELRDGNPVRVLIFEFLVAVGTESDLCLRGQHLRTGSKVNQRHRGENGERLRFRHDMLPK